jgi:hypothetical protein
MKCSLDVCDGKATKRGLCNKHYLRWWKHGDPNGGETPKGEPHTFLENTVLTYEGDECLIWPYAKASGYGQIRIGGRSFLVSRVVCEKTNGTPPSESDEAAHSCGNGHLGCVTKRHLRWATRSENREDMILHGKSLRGEKNPFANLTQNDVKKIRSLLGTMSQRKIATQFGVTQAAITSIATGKSWAWLEA